MDPDAALHEIRDVIAEIRADNDNALHRAYLLGQLVGHVDALDRWLSRGGFPPAAWTTEITDV